LQVFVDGVNTFTHPNFDRDIQYSKRDKSILRVTLGKIPGDLFLKNEHVTFWNISNLIFGPGATEGESKIVVSNGKVSCIGNECPIMGSLVDLCGSWVVPVTYFLILKGLIASDMTLGLQEISKEPLHTSNGQITHQIETFGPYVFMPSASSSIFIGSDRSKMLDAAFKAGVTTSISSLNSDYNIKGYATAFKTGSIVRDKAFVKRNSGLHAQFISGNNGQSSTISGALNIISKVFTAAGGFCFEKCNGACPQKYPFVVKVLY
jgi:hypothetical protein